MGKRRSERRLDAGSGMKMCGGVAAEVIIKKHSQQDKKPVGNG